LTTYRLNFNVRRRHSINTRQITLTLFIDKRQSITISLIKLKKKQLISIRNKLRMSEKSKVKKSKKRDLDKESEQSSAPLTQTRDIESLIEEEDHELNSSGSKPTKKSKTNITVVNNIIRLNELNYACVQAYKEQYHKFQGMNHQFDYMGNIDRIIKKQN